MRSSVPMPSATELTSAPVNSQSCAISLMNEIFSARKALTPYLMSSALVESVILIGASRCPKRPGDPLACVAVVAADDDLWRLAKVTNRAALGEELGAHGQAATTRPLRRQSDCSDAVVPGGTVLLIAMTVSAPA